MLGPDGNPLAGVSLYWPRITGEWPVGVGQTRWQRLAQSDAAGRFALTLSIRDFADRARELPLVAEREGFALDWVQIERESAVQEVSLRLPAEGRIRGRLLTTEGKPVAAAAVEVTGILASPDGRLDAFLIACKREWNTAAAMKLSRQLNTWAIGPLSFFTGSTTDAEGRFEIRGIAAEQLATLEITEASIAKTNLYVINRQGINVKPIMAAIVASRPAALRDGVSFPQLVGPTFAHVVEPGLMVTGSIYVGEKREPVPGARVWVVTGHGSIVSATADTRGRFVLTGLQRGRQFGMTITPTGKDTDLLQHAWCG